MGLFHITSRAARTDAQARSEYRPPSLDREGFIHLSGDRQWQVAANRFYRRQSDLVLLSLKPRPEAFRAEVRFEAADGDSYPHLYGPLHLDEVVEVCPLALGDRGLFEVPEGLAPWRAMFLPKAHRLPLDPAMEELIKQADDAISALLWCAIPEGQRLAPVLCAQAKPGHAGSISLKAISPALDRAQAEPALRQSDLLQLPAFPRRTDGTVDEPAVMASIERLLKGGD